jgi:TM2 domain-containing membrane protein YozV
MWASGKLTLSAQYRAPGETLWSPIADIIEELERPDARPKSRALYIVLGIFLGLLGIHNFYAARYRPAFYQLLFGVMLGWLLIPLVPLALWVLVEIIVVKRDGKKQPFA